MSEGDLVVTYNRQSFFVSYTNTLIDCNWHHSTPISHSHSWCQKGNTRFQATHSDQLSPIAPQTNIVKIKQFLFRKDRQNISNRNILTKFIYELFNYVEFFVVNFRRESGITVGCPRFVLMPISHRRFCLNYDATRLSTSVYGRIHQTGGVK